MFLPQQSDRAVQVAGLFGEAEQFRPECDQVLLRVGTPSNCPAAALDVRVTPASFEEPLRVVALTADENGNLRQVVYNAKRVPGVGFMCELEKPADLDGCSGAPVVDKDGLLVGIVTGGTFRDMPNPSGRVRSFSGHLIGELAPVMKAALSRRGTTRAPLKS